MPSDNWSIPQSAAVSDASPRRPVRLKLETARDLHKALARLIRASLGGVIDTADLGRYANAIAVLARIVNDSEFEARLDKLEREASGR